MAKVTSFNLRIILILSIFFLIASPPLGFFVVTPSIKKLIISSLEQRAAFDAKSLIYDVFKNSGARLESFLSDKGKEIVKNAVTKKIFGKVRVISTSGIIKYSTDSSEINIRTHDEKTLKKVISSSVYSKLVRLKDKTFDGEKLSINMLETYIPIFKDKNLLGYLEVYSKNIDLLEKFEKRARYINCILLVFTLLLAVSYLFFYRKVLKSELIKRAYDKKLIDKNIELKDKNFEITKLLSDKNKLIGRLGHDLNTPLTPLTALLPEVYNELQNSKTEIKEMLSICIQSTGFMKGLVKNILNYAKYDSEKYSMEFIKVDIYKLVRRIIFTFQNIIEEKKIDVKLDMDPNILIVGDEIGISEVLYNIIGNSLKFCKEKGKVEIACINEEDNSAFYQICIKDNGIGLSKDQLLEVFNEFYKADNSRSDLTSYGLGLSICKKIIKAHGGDIWAQSKGLGEGSEFYFSLRKTDELLKEENQNYQI